MYDSTERFTDRVDNYVRFRPRYPPDLLDICEKLFDLKPMHVIADIGAGTGLSSELFVKNGNPVFGVEPNDAMRRAAQVLFLDYPKFYPVDGTAEKTNLPDNSVDFIIVGQAFHWFDHKAFEKEALRILKKHGWLLIMWNSRTSDTPFNRAYEGLCQRFGTDYLEVNHTNNRASILLDRMQELRLVNTQVLDLEALTGRFMSSSYAPKPGDEQYESCLAEIDLIFQEHQIEGLVMLNYNTEIYYIQV